MPTEAGDECDSGKQPSTTTGITFGPRLLCRRENILLVLSFQKGDSTNSSAAGM